MDIAKLGLKASILSVALSAGCSHDASDAEQGVAAMAKDRTTTTATGVCGPGVFYPPSVATDGTTTVVGCVPVAPAGGGQVTPAIVLLDAQLRPTRSFPLRPTHGNPYPAGHDQYFEGIDVRSVGHRFAASYAYDCEPSGSLAQGIGGSCIDLRQFDAKGEGLDRSVVFGEAVWSGYPVVATDGLKESADLGVAFTSYVERGSKKWATLQFHEEGPLGSRTVKVAEAADDNPFENYRAVRPKVAWNASTSTWGIFTAFPDGEVLLSQVGSDGAPIGELKKVVENFALGDTNAQFAVAAVGQDFWVAGDQWLALPDHTWGRVTSLTRMTPDGSHKAWIPLSTTRYCTSSHRDVVSMVAAHGKLFVAWQDPGICSGDAVSMLAIVDAETGAVQTRPILPGNYVGSPALAVDEDATTVRVVFLDEEGSVSAVTVQP